MSTVSSQIDFLPIFNCYLTSGTANNLHVLFRGAILAFRERTITACMAAAWLWVTKHWTVYENTIRIAKFNSLLFARCLFQCILSLIPKELPILFIIDESLVRRYGPYVSGIGTTFKKAPVIKKARVGRKPVKGKKLPSPAEIAQRKKTRWIMADVDWYGDSKRTIQYISRTGYWYKCGYKPTWIRWVLVRDPEGKKTDEVFFTTSRKLSAIQIIEYYVRRWPLETTFQEVREHLGLETMRNRSRNAIIRSVPFLLSVYSIVIVWFTKCF